MYKINSISGKFCSKRAQEKGSVFCKSNLNLGIGLWYKKAKSMQPIPDNILKKFNPKILKEAMTINDIKKPLWVY